MTLDRQPTLEGDRLLLRPLRADDWEALFAAACDPAIWAGHPAHDRWREPVFRDFFAEALTKGGALVVIDKASGAVIGSSRFQEYDPADGGSVEIGWTFLARSHWGGTYNRELKRLMLAHALRSVEQAIFLVGKDNIRSRTAMTRIGGRLTDRTTRATMAGKETTHVVFEIGRADFAAGPLASG